MDRKSYSQIECGLIVVVMCAILLPLSIFVMRLSDLQLDPIILKSVDVTIGVITIVALIFLIIWVKSGQALNSRLWIWLPPFVFFKSLPPKLRILFVWILCIVQLLSFGINLIVRLDK